MFFYNLYIYRYIMDDEKIVKKKTINLLSNGRLFPTYIMKNFKNFILPKNEENTEDPCQLSSDKTEIQKYQSFISKYMDYASNNNSLLMYHDVGTGKTASAVFFMNMMFNSNPDLNIFILIKAGLHNVWENELNKWLDKNGKEQKMDNIHFINFDSPFSATAFDKIKKETDSSRKNVYIIDECQLFISRVLSNMRSGKYTSLKIYDTILNEKRENNSTKIICMSATPSVNEPFELALLFNLLRPDIFPTQEQLFTKYFIDNSTGVNVLNYRMKNLFQRRIIGLVSYYKPQGQNGSYALKTVIHEDVMMSEYQTEKYKFFEKIEYEMNKHNKATKSTKSSSYRTYVRQASNFVFPDINQTVNSDNRPRPSKFKINDKELAKLIEGTEKNITTNENAYMEMLLLFEKTLEEYMDEIYEKDLKTNKNIKTDIESFKKYEKFEDYVKNEKNKSNLMKEMIRCSCKYSCAIFNMYKTKGPIIFYMNYIVLEGIHIFKIYLNFFGFKNYLDKKSTDFHRYAQFTGEASKEERKEAIKLEQLEDNNYGKHIKIIFFSSAGAEGISMYHIRQVHILEPFWNEARIEQVIGRGIRFCSHKYLPMDERQVDVYRYRTIKNNIETTRDIVNKEVKITTKIIEDDYLLKTVDYDIEKVSRNKNNVLQSFYDAMKEMAVDCELFKNQNMANKKYTCFKFNESALFDKNIGPAYKESIEEDMKINNGLNSTNSISIKIKVIKIKGIIEGQTEYQDYWYNPEPEHNTVYDFELHYVVGKVKRDVDGIPEKLDINTYIIEAIEIPII
jgi:superfamily II DNA or RNA helicase